MKFEYKKHEKKLYLPKDTPELLTVPMQKFFMISGKGNPNNEEFSKKTAVLYSLSYAIKMMPKKNYTPQGYFDYTVYPLEGLWDLTKKGRKSIALDKEELIYTIMIRQPDFVTQDVFLKALDNAKKKKADDLLNEVAFDTMQDGLSVQMMHIGPYDVEQKSFDKMKVFIKENDLEIKTLKHREIYISDPRKTESSKLKTVLRYCVFRS